DWRTRSRGPLEPPATKGNPDSSWLSQQTGSPDNHAIERKPDRHQEIPHHAVDVNPEPLFRPVPAGGHDYDQHGRKQEVRDEIEGMEKQNAPDDRAVRIAGPVEIQPAPFRKS